MSSTHTIDATIGVGDPDLGAEIEARITFTFHERVAEQGPSYASGGQPAEAAMAEWGSAVPLKDGKPAPFDGAYADLAQGSLDSIAADWLESDEGQAQACEQALDDLQADEDDAAERRAEQRAEDRWNA